MKVLFVLMHFLKQFYISLALPLNCYIPDNAVPANRAF